MSLRPPVVAVLALVISAPLAAADWPQLLGPTRNGVYTGPALAEKWPAAGPRVVWRRTVGQGLSGPVVADGRVILFHRTNNREMVEALDPATGATRWRYDYATA
jgi:outer membrane protein assembly factor BamB